MFFEQRVSIKEHRETVKEREVEEKAERRSAAGSRFEDLQPILDRDARGFYLVLRIESTEKSPDLLRPVGLQVFFPAS